MILIIIVTIMIIIIINIIISHLYSDIYKYVSETYQFSRACKFTALLWLRLVLLAKYVCSAVYGCFL
jgi:hypothetical protein